MNIVVRLFVLGKINVCQVSSIVILLLISFIAQGCGMYDVRTVTRTKVVDRRQTIKHYQIEVTSKPPGATIYIDNVEKGETPCTITIDLKCYVEYVQDYSYKWGGFMQTRQSEDQPIGEVREGKQELKKREVTLSFFKPGYKTSTQKIIVPDNLKVFAILESK